MDNIQILKQSDIHDRWCNYMLSHGDHNCPCDCNGFQIFLNSMIDNIRELEE